MRFFEAEGGCFSTVMLKYSPTSLVDCSVGAVWFSEERGKCFPVGMVKYSPTSTIDCSVGVVRFSEAGGSIGTYSITSSVDCSVGTSVSLLRFFPVDALKQNNDSNAKS